MRTQRRLAGVALFRVRRDAASVLLTAACALSVACGDDDNHRRLSTDDASIVSSGSDGGTVRADGSAPTGDGKLDSGAPGDDLDASVADAATVPDDGADGSLASGDAALAGDAEAVVADGGNSSIDAAGPEGADAGPDLADAGPEVADAGPCPINHPLYGCGRAVSESWVVFDNGLEIDRVNQKAWSPIVPVVDDDALRDLCTPLSLGGLTGFDMPQMSDVRTLAAGCAATVPGGSCQVDEDMVFLDEAGDCTCSEGVGPNNGKFCRPEVTDCETIWVWTHTDETGWYQHWFYDVDTGSIVPEQVGVGIAVPAKGRCVRDLSADELP